MRGKASVIAEIVKVNAKRLKSFGEQNFAPNVVYQSNDIKVVLAYFKENQFIPIHTPAAEDQNEVHAKLAKGKFE